MNSRRPVNSDVMRSVHTHQSRLFLAVVLFFFAVCISCARPEPYSAVPQALRSRLDERLKLFVANMRDQRYADAYDLFSDAYKNELKGFRRSTKAEYVAVTNGLPKSIPPFYSFTPKSSVETGNYTYRVFGIITSRDNAQSFDNDASLEARWQTNDWYFSDFRDERMR